MSPTPSSAADSGLELEKLRDAVQRAEQAEKVQRALFAISHAADQDIPLPGMLEQVRSIISELMYADNFYVALHNRLSDSIDFLYMVDSVGGVPASGMSIPMAGFENSLTWHLVHHGKPLRGSMAAIARQLPGPVQPRGGSPEDWMGVPMLDQGEVRGVLVVQNYERSDCFTEADQNLLYFVGSHVLAALQRRRRREDLEQAVLERTTDLDRTNHELKQEVQERQRGERLQRALYRIAELAGGAESMEDFCRAIHDIVGDLVNVRNFFIAVLSADGTRIEFPYYVDAQVLARSSRPVGKGMTEYVLRTGRPVLAHSAALHSLLEVGEIELSGQLALCWLGVPLMVDGRAMGVVAVQSYSADVSYSERDRELLQFVSSQIASSLERRRMTASLHAANAQLEQRVSERTAQLQAQVAERERVELQLKHQVMHDGLTGLPNRGYLFDRIERLLARQGRDPARGFAVMFMDVDRFKVINDSVGHHAGDAVLQEVARRLTAPLRDPDFVARLGGDEFAVLIEDVPNLDTVVRIARRLMAALEAPIMVADRKVFASTSIGIALYDPRYPSAEDMLRNADAAMYRAKSNGRRRFELFDERLHNDAVRVLEMENALRVAIEQRQIQPVFQPVVRLADGATVGYEALMRWHHPERGVLAPGEFLRLAEDSGAIETIDWQVYESAFRTFAALPLAGYLSVNVAPRHFCNSAFGLRMLRLLAQTGLAPERLRLEITENALIEDPERTNDIMQALHEQGIRMALDDFGTGYSSLGYLHRFPFSVLKIDRSFVTPLEDADPRQRGKAEALIRAVLALAGSLELRVVAEGIETEGQKQRLMQLGCHLGQGYLLGRPGPAPV